MDSHMGGMGGADAHDIFKMFFGGGGMGGMGGMGGFSGMGPGSRRSQNFSYKFNWSAYILVFVMFTLTFLQQLVLAIFVERETPFYKSK